MSEHHVGGNDELDSGDVLDGEVVEEPNAGGKGADEEAEGPLEQHVLQDLAGAAGPPIFIEEIVLRDPAVDCN